ncbi:MAG: LptF/LptG family permease [Alphaproteobacteria bacterium]|nr:LptF/LptG family permease [Alphaproteobacteria bacterium]
MALRWPAIFGGRVFEHYVFKNMVIVGIVVAMTLAAIIFLTQSLRFLELVMNAGASSASFWLLTFLALPRFFEIILPFSILAAAIFIYHRMSMDSELTVMRATGFSPFALARPLLALSVLMMVLLFVLTLWASPKALASMQHLREVIRAQISSVLFREGVFNPVGSGLTVYVRERAEDGSLLGLMIYDHRAKNTVPATITARRGVIQSEPSGHRVIVYDGARQQRDPKTGILRFLRFSRYTIEIPNQGEVRERWAEPDERSCWQLFHPDPNVPRDGESLRQFTIEINRRLVAPLIAPLFALVACAFMLPGAMERRSMARRIIGAIVCSIIIQGLHLSALSAARKTDWGFVLLYANLIIPAGLALYVLRTAEDGFLRVLFYPRQKDVS